MKKVFIWILSCVCQWVFVTTAFAYPNSFAPLVEKTSSAVVSISGQASNASGAVGGSGFIMRKDGYIITNNHVVENVKNIRATLKDGTSYDVKIVGRDPNTDLAVLQLQDLKGAVPFLELADSDDIRVGDWVIAIGNPLGLGHTVTKGIVSARNRNIQAGLYDDFIQTDAPINQGNSGGPLINMDGNVVGVNSMILSRSGGSIGLGFSIPSNLVKYVSDQLLVNGRVVRAWLGVTLDEVTPEIAESIDLPSVQGAVIIGVVPDDPADKAGILAGDVILSVNGKTVTSKQRLPSLIAVSPIGKPIDFGVWRNGKEIRIQVILTERNTDTSAIGQIPQMQVPQGRAILTPFGVELSNITTALARKYQLQGNIKGVVVTGFQGERGENTRRYLPEGGVIVRMNNKIITSIADVNTVMTSVLQNKKRNVLFMVRTPQGAKVLITLPVK